MTRVTSGAGESKLNKYTLLGAFRDFVLLVKNFVLFDYLNGKYHKNQVVQVSPYQFEPEPGLQTSNSGDERSRATRKKRVPNRLTGKSTMCLRQKMLGALKA